MSRENVQSRREEVRRKREAVQQLCQDLVTTLDTKEKLVAVWLVATNILPDYALTPEQEALLEKVNGTDGGHKGRIISFMTHWLMEDVVRARRAVKRTKKSQQKKRK